MAESEEKPRCCKCGQLESKDFSNVSAGRVEGMSYRCGVGRYDSTERVGGGKVPRYFAWGGIVKPNKTVAAAQEGCREFVKGSPR